MTLPEIILPYPRGWPAQKESPTLSSTVLSKVSSIVIFYLMNELSTVTYSFTAYGEYWKIEDMEDTVTDLVEPLILGGRESNHSFVRA